jgi:hypothetical protein
LLGERYVLLRPGAPEFRCPIPGLDVIGLAGSVRRVEGEAGRARFLVSHDYGMGGLWWWFWARSATEVVERLAEVEVVAAPETIAWARDEGFDEVDLDAAWLPEPLDETRATRDVQRGRPGFGALAGRSPVYVRRRDDEEMAAPGFVYWELDAAGRRMREVESYDDGTAARFSGEDLMINAPVVDPYDPEAAGWEIGAEEFEAAWRRAIPGSVD